MFLMAGLLTQLVGNEEEEESDDDLGHRRLAHSRGNERKTCLAAWRAYYITIKPNLADEAKES